MRRFFVVGCPRSGTTMVQQALNRHTRVAIPPETKFFFSFLGHGRSAQRRHLDRINADLGLRLELPPGGVRTDDEARAFYDRMAAGYVARVGRPGVTCFGEKTPEHTTRLAEIRRVFPDAKVVVVSRDGRDVALSLSKTPWAPPGLYANFVVWLYYQTSVLRARTEADPNLHFVRYEDVVARPAPVFRGVLDFLGLRHESAVAEGCGNRDGVPARELGWKANALRAICRDRVGAFRRELTAGQVAVLERLGGGTLDAFGYPLLTDGKSRLPLRLFPRLAYDLGRFLARVPWRSACRELLGRARAELGRLLPPRCPALLPS